MGFLDEIVNQATVAQHISQGSDAWDEIRLGRFTSSEWYKLMDCGKRPMTEAELKARPLSGKGSKTTQILDPTTMGDKGLTYIRRKVWETLSGLPMEEAYAYPMVRGKEMEPLAVEAFEAKFKIVTHEVGFQPFGDHAGGSPDRLIGETEGLEIKCPSSDVQIDYLMLTDHYDLKRNYPQFYWQCVSLMLFTNRKLWRFCTFDPRIQVKKLQLTHITIEWEKVEEDIDLVVKALEAAIKEKLEMIQRLQ